MHNVIELMSYAPSNFIFVVRHKCSLLKAKNPSVSRIIPMNMTTSSIKILSITFIGSTIYQIFSPNNQNHSLVCYLYTDFFVCNFNLTITMLYIIYVIFLYDDTGRELAKE
ncbi:hypothetical protein Patl1_19078 [Pistacia atlantica]|uniref:Uncharacterized protein n=1 Tax=Pistacia atlantica TaxID=434234 RepID=A0ACC1C0E4_9ROSI|nr:hypothetical protein Patl1_19078 [Pistacia atlantica]